MSMATGEDSRLINWILGSRGAAFLEAKMLDSLLVQPKCFFSDASSTEYGEYTVESSPKVSHDKWSTGEIALKST